MRTPSSDTGRSSSGASDTAATALGATVSVGDAPLILPWMEKLGRLNVGMGRVLCVLMPAKGDEADVADGAGDEVADTGRAGATACCGAAVEYTI